MFVCRKDPNILSMTAQDHASQFHCLCSFQLPWFVKIAFKKVTKWSKIDVAVYPVAILLNHVKTHVARLVLDAPVFSPIFQFSSPETFYIYETWAVVSWDYSQKGQIADPQLETDTPKRQPWRCAFETLHPLRPRPPVLSITDLTLKETQPHVRSTH